MKTKEAKDYLLQIKKLDSLINNKIAEVEHWKDVAFGTGTYSDGERVQSSGNKQKMASAVEKYTDIQAEITADIDRLINLKQEVIKTIEQLPVAEYDLLHKVYVQGWTLDMVAELNDRSRSWADTVHGRALVSLQKVLNERAEQKLAELKGGAE